MLIYDPWIWLISWHNFFFHLCSHGLEPCSAAWWAVNPTIVPLYHASDGLFLCRDSFMYTNLKFLSKRPEPLARGRIRPGQWQYSLITGRDTALWLLQWLSLRQRNDAEPEPEPDSGWQQRPTFSWSRLTVTANLMVWRWTTTDATDTWTSGPDDTVQEASQLIHSSSSGLIMLLNNVTLGYCIDLFALAQLWS